MVRKVEKDRIKILATGNKTLSGFTIIEILVAFFILAIAALAFSSLITDSSRSINLIEERFLANNIAENLALKNLVKDDYLTSSQYDEGEETFLEFTSLLLSNQEVKTIQGLAHKEKPFYSIQCHPEASPGPKEFEVLFKKFFKEMNA